MNPAIEVLKSLIAEVETDMVAAELAKEYDFPGHDSPYVRGLRHGQQDARDNVLRQLRERLKWAEQAEKVGVEP